MIKFKAKIYLLPSEKGGRKSPILPKYRPNLLFDEVLNVNTDGQFMFNDSLSIYPGEYLEEVVITPLNSDEIKNYISINSEFIFREGVRVVGTGKITEIL